MKTILVRLGIVLGAVAVLAVVAFGVLAVVASRRIDRRWDVPVPAMQADRSLAAVARGAALFQAECLACHGGPDGRASGKRMTEVPTFLGVFRSANLTAHPTAGVGRVRDGDLARAIRSGVLPDGGRAIGMPTYPGLSDADLSAVLGFLRSDDPLVAPDATVQARPSPSLAGKLVLAFVAGVEPARVEGPVSAPARGPTPEYGAYLANEVLLCYDCHTPGFGADKLRDPKAYAGGLELLDDSGRPLLSSNVTPDHETGLGRWSREDLVRALRDGLRPDGSGIRPPMLRLRSLGDDEVTAVAAYLETLKPVRNVVPRDAVAPAMAHAAAGPGADLFAKHGCAACHGPKGPYRDRLRAAAGRPLEEVAARILHPERFAPGSAMPTYANVLDETAARRLAEYVQALEE